MPKIIKSSAVTDVNICIMSIRWPKKYSYLAWGGALALALYLVVTPAVLRADTITIAADEWCPYNCAGDAEEPGFMIEIATEILTRNGHQVIYEVVPWSRAIEKTRQGKYTAIIGAYKEDAPDFIFPNRAFGQSYDAFYVRNNSDWRYEGIESLSKISLGVIKDYSYGSELDAYIGRFSNDLTRVQALPGDKALEVNLNKLLLDRINALVEDPAVMTYYLQSRPSLKDKIKKVGEVSPSNVYIAFSPALPASKDYARIVDQGYDQLVKEGWIEKVLSKYGITP